MQNKNRSANESVVFEVSLHSGDLYKLQVKAIYLQGESSARTTFFNNIPLYAF